MNVVRLASYTGLVMLGCVITWNAAPRLEAEIFPVLDNIYLVPIDPAHPNVFVKRDNKYACWKQHVHKTRNAVSRRWAITIILPNGTRFYTGPTDGRTMTQSSSKDVYSGGFDGNVPICAIIPDEIPQGQDFDIESYAQYETEHHFWYITQSPNYIHVPALVGAP